MSETGLTPSQLIFMQMLDEDREQTAGHIAQRMGITQATATFLLQKLEASDMIQRRKGETDRRQAWLSLTSTGQQALAIAPDGAHPQFHSQFVALQDWGQAMRFSSLEHVAAMLGNTDDGAAAIAQSKDIISED